MINKKEFVEKISNKLSISKSEAERVCETVSDTLVEVLLKGKKFRFLNFGTFSIVHRAERKGVNPKTGKPVLISAKKVLKFKASTGTGERIANS